MDARVRQQVRERQRPRIDVLEMEAAFGANLYDFSRLRQAAGHDKRAYPAIQLAQRAHQWSLGLAYDTLRHIKDDDVVYATGEDVGFPLAAMMRARHLTRPRLIVRLEEPNYGRTVWRRLAYNLHRHYALARIDKLVCRTSAHLQFLHSVDRVPMSKLVVVKEPVDPAFFSATAADEPPGLESIAHKPYIVSAGLEMRDYPTLIEAVRGLPVNLIIGAGSPWSHSRFDGRDRGRMPPNVHVSSFLPTQMRDLYRFAAFVVVPIKPTLRTCGVSVMLEAWSMERAVIVSRTTGLLDYVTEDEDALFVDPYNVQALRTRIAYLLEHRDVAERLGRNGRVLVEREHALPEYVRQIGSIMASTLNELPRS